jgi:hypothetical protein
MPKSSANKNNSIIPKQILGGESGGASSVSKGSAGGGNQGTPPDLLASYRLTSPQTASVPAKQFARVPINTNDAQSSSTAVTSQTPFTYTAPAFGFVLVEVRINASVVANLGRWCAAFRITRNSYTSDAAYTFHKKKASATVWQFALNARLWLETNDVLQVELRAFNEGAVAETLTVLDAEIVIKRG